MRFEIERVSADYEEDGFTKKKPVPEAAEAKAVLVDERTSKTPAEFDVMVAARFGDPKWLDKGTNHRTSPTGGIRRDVGTESVYIIDIPDLDALLAFMEREGNLIIGKSNVDKESPTITIYDGYIA